MKVLRYVCSAKVQRPFCGEVFWGGWFADVDCGIGFVFVVEFVECCRERLVYNNFEGRILAMKKISQNSVHHPVFVIDGKTRTIELWRFKRQQAKLFLHLLE